MWSWINASIDLVVQYPNWALGCAFLAAIIEAVALFGTIIPGTFILMAIAAAAGAAGHSMLPYLVLAIVGAVIGDFISYWVGYRYRMTIRACWPFSRRPHLLEHADRFFHRFGSASVAICRFIPVLRSTVPMIAGVSGMARNRFVVANVLSAFVWAPAHVFPAQFAGITIDRIRVGDTESAMMWGAAMLLCVAGVWMASHRLVKWTRV